jgi:hypothetical protein
VARALATPSIEWLLVHQEDAELGGCPFEQIIELTPKVLLRGGLFKPIAHRWFAEPSYCAVTVSTIAQALNATPETHAERRGASASIEGGRQGVASAWCGRRTSPASSEMGSPSWTASLAWPRAKSSAENEGAATSWA